MRKLWRRTAAVATAVGLAMAPVQAAAISLIRDAEIERTVERLTTPILRAAGLPQETVNIYIVNDRNLNAFVAGGRNIFLHTGLLEELETPGALMGVIAHETGHITGGHIARRTVNARAAQGPALIGSLLAVAAAAAAGNAAAGAAVALGSQTAVQRAFLRFNRAEEAAADQAALLYLERAGVSPEGFRDVLRLFRGQEVLSFGNLDPYTLTHPLSTQREQLIAQAADAAQEKTYPANPERDYWHARMRAKLEGFLDTPARVLDRYADAEPTEFVRYARAVALHRLPSPDEAVAEVDRLIALRPDDPYYLELKGQILFESGRAEAALPHYRRAVALAPDEVLLRAGLGRVLLAQDTPETDREALRILESARRADAGDPSMLRDLAIAYDRSGDRGMATLLTAERYALRGARQDAILHARRASALLSEGSPGWLRAQDILAMDKG